MDDAIFFLAMAVDRLGGTLTITDAEWEAFDMADRKLKVDFLPNGDTVITVEDNDLPDGAWMRNTRTDGTVVTISEAA